MRPFANMGAGRPFGDARKMRLQRIKYTVRKLTGTAMIFAVTRWAPSHSVAIAMTAAVTDKPATALRKYSMTSLASVFSVRLLSNTYRVERT